MKYIKIFIGIALSGSALVSCTKLEEKFQGDLTPGQVAGGSSSVDALLKGAYASMQNSFQEQGNVFSLQELSGDAAIVPTRGGDWDDNGAWRQLHSHQWDADNTHVRDCFNALSGTVFLATDLLQYTPSAQQGAEARFLRAFSMFEQLDLYDQVPYREPGESTLEPAKVRKGSEALDFIISEAEAIMNDLPDGPAGTANKWAAKVLLMKCYLNKGVFANRAAPTFDAADMQKVIGYGDEIINSGKFAFSTSYYDNFAPDNTDATKAKENIFTKVNVGGEASGGSGNSVRSRWYMTTHYNMNPGGWNGFSTLSDFYDKFEASDKRRGEAYALTGIPNPGKRVNVGFLAGQQYNLTTDAALTDRTGAPLSFTAAVKSIETENNLEVTGIRVNKYGVDYTNDNSGNVDNDYVYYRYADVLLMKAEAALRGGGSTSTALDLVNQVRSNRGASTLSALTLDVLLDERGRELYWEEYRRQDLIRFGKFLQVWQEKPSDDPKNLLFPIPNQQLSVNPNLTKNPGY